MNETEKKEQYPDVVQDEPPKSRSELKRLALVDKLEDRVALTVVGRGNVSTMLAVQRKKKAVKKLKQINRVNK